MKESERLALNRRTVKREQLKETLYVGYYIVFAVEYTIKLLLWAWREAGCNNIYKRAYSSVSFIVEQKSRERFFGWAERRDRFYWTRYVKQLKY